MQRLSAAVGVVLAASVFVVALAAMGALAALLGGPALVELISGR